MSQVHFNDEQATSLIDQLQANVGSGDGFVITQGSSGSIVVAGGYSTLTIEADGEAVE
jgi:hypothetical protein